MLSFYIFFVGYCMMSNLGQSIIDASGLSHLLFKLTVYDLNGYLAINDMLRFQFICIAALNLGSAIYLSKPGRVVTIQMQRDNYQYNLPKEKHDDLFDVIMLVSMIFFIYQCFHMVVLRQSYDYATFFELGRGQTQNRLTSYMDFAVVILSMRCIFRGRRLKLVYGFYFLSIVLYMYVGARGLAIRFVAMALTTLPFVRPDLFRKRYIAFWIIGFIMSFSVLSVISSSRSSVLGSSTGANEGLGMNIVNTVAEMGLSERPPILTIQAINNGQEHYQTIASTLLKAWVPFTSSTNFSQRNSVTLGDWVSDYAGSYHSGLGSSIVAEAYMNFDWFGWIFFLVWGLFITYAENKAYRDLINGKYLYSLWLLTLICTLVVFARSEFAHAQEVLRWGEYFFIYRLINPSKSI